MTTRELIEQVQLEMGGSEAVSLVSAKKALDAVLAAIATGITTGGLRLNGIGNFSIKERPARTCTNPKTKEPIEVPASNAIVFRAFGKLKDSVNNN